MKQAISILAGIAVLGAPSASRLWSAEPAASASVVTNADGKVDINTAEIPVLEAIPEIGTSFANAVVAGRPFKSVFELQPILKLSGERMVALHAKVIALPPKTLSPLATKGSKAAPTPVPTAAVSGEASLPPALATEQERMEARRRHIRRDGLSMSEPPPPARNESKPASPGSNYVWKPGHWAPAKGEWQWTPGEWFVPPTPISVWIDGVYDAKAQRWSPGYWEPDRLQPPEE